MMISIIGLGLIGASFAKAIKAKTDHKVTGFDINIDVLNSAIDDKTIDFIGNDELLSQSDMVIVSLYPSATLDFVKQNAEKFKSGAIVIDTCGIKSEICKELTAVSTENSFVFVGAHPMAGKETSGYVSSCSDLFDNAYMILTPLSASEETVNLLKDFSAKLGFKGVTISTPLEHDKIIAYTSQLPHVLACAYISDPDAVRHDGFSAGSYKDVSRVATINATMWTELFIENKDCLTSHIDTLIENLQKLKTYIEKEDGESLSKMLDDGDKIKKRIG